MLAQMVCLEGALCVSLLVGGTASPNSTGTALEERARRLDAQLMAPCCFSETIDQHLSPAAKEMRGEVRFLLAQGLTDRQVLDHFVEQYGLRILAAPPEKGFNQLLYVLPYLVSGLLIVVAGWTLWKWYRRGHPTGDANSRDMS